MRIIHLLIAISLFAGLHSCTTQKRIPNSYLENQADTSRRDTFSFPEIAIQKGDVLSIQIFSTSTRPEVDQLYNVASIGAGSAVTGFLVDANGDIEYPRVGKFHAEGLTKTVLGEQIKSKLEGQLVQPTVVIRFINYRVTVLGEVNSPGSYIVPTERITILEALGLAGDITEFGKRNTVKVVREGNGRREIGLLDLTSGDLFASPFYKLQQNDVVFVEATRAKTKRAEQQTLIQQIGFVTTGLTAIALILNFIK